MHGAPIVLWLTAGKIGALRTEPPFRKVPLGGAVGSSAFGIRHAW